MLRMTRNMAYCIVEYAIDRKFQIRRVMSMSTNWDNQPHLTHNRCFRVFTPKGGQEEHVLQCESMATVVENMFEACHGFGLSFPKP